LDAQAGERPSGIAVTRNGGGRRIFNHGNTDATPLPDTGYSDTGGPSRFFPTFEWTEDDLFPLYYCPKPSRAEREAGCDALPLKSAGEVTGGREDGSAGLDSPRAGAGRKSGARNNHPTVKPLDLMRWLCRLITPPGGVCLDPFAGSGTTLIAATSEGFRAIGFELDPHHVDICNARIRHHVGGHYRTPEQLKQEKRQMEEEAAAAWVEEWERTHDEDGNEIEIENEQPVSVATVRRQLEMF